MKKTNHYTKYLYDAFLCPNCTVYSKREWNDRWINGDDDISICKYQHCGYLSFWYLDKLECILSFLVEVFLKEIDKLYQLIPNNKIEGIKKDEA